MWQTVPRAVPASVVPDPEQGLLVRSDTADFAPRVNPTTTGVDERDGRQVLAGDRVTVHAVVGASAVFSSALTAIVDGVGPVAATRGYGVGVFAGLGDQLALGEVEIPPTIGAIGYLLEEDRLRGGAGFWVAYSRSMARAILSCSATCCRLSAVGACMEPPKVAGRTECESARPGFTVTS